MKKLREKRGFTLVELIVVMAILAILASLLVPSLTGYIDRAKDEKIKSETRMLLMALQTEISTTYAQGDLPTNTSWSDAGSEGADHIQSIRSLAEIADTAHFAAEMSADGTVESLDYYSDDKVCTYQGSSGSYTVQDADDTPPLSDSITFP